MCPPMLTTSRLGRRRLAKLEGVPKNGWVGCLAWRDPPSPRCPPIWRVFQCRIPPLALSSPLEKSRIPIVYILNVFATSFLLSRPPDMENPAWPPWRHNSHRHNSLRHNSLRHQFPPSQFLSLAHGGAVPLREHQPPASCQTPAPMPARAAPDRLRNTAATTAEACGAVAVVALAQWRWVVAMVADRPSDGRLAPASPSPPSPPPIVMTTGPTACTAGNLLTEAGASLGRQRQGL